MEGERVGGKTRSAREEWWGKPAGRSGGLGKPDGGGGAGGNKTKSRGREIKKEKR